MMEELGGKAISKEELRETWDPSYMVFWNKYHKNLTVEEEQKLYYKTVLRDDFPKSEVYDGIVDLIKKLKENGVEMVVLSSDPERILLPEVERFGLDGVFREVVAGVPEKSVIIKDLIQRNNFNPLETVLIGDNANELDAGKSIGAKTIAVTWGFCTEEKLKEENPDFLVHNIKELEKILLS
jgi:phosphoglycolate phosphatase